MDEIKITHCGGGAFAVVSATINGRPVDVVRRNGKLLVCDTRSLAEIPGAVPAVLAEAYARAQAESREYHRSYFDAEGQRQPG